MKENLSILIVANSCRWQSWPDKLGKLQSWFLQKFKEVEVDLVHTSYTNIPFISYSFNNDPRPLRGIEPEWYDRCVTPIAVGYNYDIVLFVVNKEEWKLPNVAMGWRTDNDQGVVQLHVIGDEEDKIIFPDGTHAGSFYVYTRHEINHALYMLADQEDHTHANGDTDEGARRSLDEIVFREPNTAEKIGLITKLLNGLLLKLGLLVSAKKDGTSPPFKYEQDPAFPIKNPPLPPENKVNLLEEFCLAIQEHEGWHPAGSPGFPTGSRSWRNKNPGNVKYIGQWRAIGKDNQNFAVFPTYKDGFETLKDQIKFACSGKSKIYSPEMTIVDFFSKYAPSYDNNNPLRYAQIVARKIGVEPTFIIKNLIV